MKNTVRLPYKITLAALLIIIMFVGYLFFNNDIGIHKSDLISDVRSSQKIKDDWITDGNISDTMAAFISYPDDRTDHTYSIYVNRPGLSFGYFFRSGGDLTATENQIVEYTLEGYSEIAFISMNKAEADRVEIDDGDSVSVVDIDSGKPFAIILPANAGNIVFYDVNGNPVDFVKMMGFRITAKT